MLMRIFKLTALAATAATALAQSADSIMSRQLEAPPADFDWEITAEDGFPIIVFNDTSEESEVVFRFNFTGSLTPTKFLEVNLYQSDCITAADELALAFVNTTNLDDSELDIDLDIIQETISNSDHYTDLNSTSAAIGFCVRVDYNYIDNEGNTTSVNFYETNVTIAVDLTAGFELAEIQVTRTAASQEAADAELDYEVEAYFCLDDNSLDVPGALAQGSALQVCIQINGSVETQNVFVEDILTFEISQPLGTDTPSTRPILNGNPDPLTDKVCVEDGICNVKTQLLSKFFTDQEPADLRVDGIAILAFGKAPSMPSAAPTAGATTRRLRAPIRGLLSGEDVKAFMAAHQEKNGGDETALVVNSDSSGRMLQDGGAAQSEFGLEVGLVGTGGEGSDSGTSPMVAAVVVLLLLGVAGGLIFVFLTKRRRKAEKEEVKHIHQSAGSVNTYPESAAPSVNSYNSSPNQYPQYRGGRDQQIN
jgi:archaellin